MRKLVLAVLVTAFAVELWGQAAPITREFTWEFSGRVWTLTHTFSGDAYRHFRSLPRVAAYTAYADYALEPSNDVELASLIADMEGMAHSAGLNVWEKLNLVVAFVQSLRYEAEEGEYPRYPIETLVEGCGDCEDFAILTAAIFEQMGFGVVLLAFTAENHMAVGIRVLPPNAPEAVSYEWSGDRYYYLETTATGWAIGTMPTRYTSSPEIIPVAPTTP